MKEDLLHFIWRTRRFDPTDLKTTAGEPLVILQTGTHNSHAGPDFVNARIQIGETQWAGNVEMHLRASEWNEHRHTNDKAYDNVVLHVVLEEDEIIRRASGERIPCLEMKKRIPQKIAATYQKLLENEYWIPCRYLFYQAADLTKNMWADRLLIERLEAKTAEISERLAQNQNHWEETFYQFLARNFGVKINAEPFEMLARETPLQVLSKYKNNLFQIEALLFGQAGLLDKTFEKADPNALKKEYHFLQKKHGLSPLGAAQWKFLRLRPANFPTVRIAQFAALIYHSTHLFSKILEAEQVAAIEQLFEMETSEYWRTHYTFDKVSQQKEKTVGKNTVRLFVINTIAPFLFLYGKMRNEEVYKNKALKLLEQTPAEVNSIMKSWETLGWKATSAYQSQAMLQLKTHYCDRKKCLDCAIGSALLKENQ